MTSFDYLEIVNDGVMVGKYCGQRTGQNILLTGDQIMMNFYSDSDVETRGFLIYFNSVSHGKYFFPISNVCFTVKLNIEYLSHAKNC